MHRIHPLIRSIIRANWSEIPHLSTQETLSIWRTDSCRFEHATHADVALDPAEARLCDSYLRDGLKRRQLPLDVCPVACLSSTLFDRFNVSFGIEIKRAGDRSFPHGNSHGIISSLRYRITFETLGLLSG